MIRKLNRVLTVPVILTAVVTLVAWEVLGLQIAAAFLFLVVLETTMGVKSAVPMAGVATRIDERSRRIFLTFGLVVGELLGRLLLPEFAVAVEHAREGDTHLWNAFIEVVTDPSAFASDLLHIRPAIAAYGAVFVWLVFAEYLFNTDRTSRGSWLGPAEARLARVRRPWLASISTAVIGATVGAFLVPPHAALIIFACGAAGGATYALSKGIAAWARRGTGGRRVSVHAGTVIFERALVIFLMCEILDGVSVLQSVKAVPSPVLQILIASAAVTVGAVLLALVTGRVVASDGLARHRHLKAGAAYCLGALSILLWASLIAPIPGIVASWVATVIILAALITSLPIWERLVDGLRARLAAAQARLRA
ncbi:MULTISPECIES: DUF475 domain-containing protein [unclassified Pseudoclavibacter]|uniref:DUF475 domain-containing protein n=1 Tax=unclassified Pseudoclavibacter TaxID=2615177 RepID=UPI0015CE4683|nr:MULTISPECIES: DUF475 domain-containing protein [unclassified Pseudoclavibacter]MBS3179822.1 DUF475 domain-containing protein [Pseudoclavibacter sp. Marseille-Q4354]NYF14350.1 hypothetical protein [Pseudoclavibacter sp. JAI123]